MSTDPSLGNIEIQAVSKVYPGGATALRAVDLEIVGTGMFGLVGPNGAGKTTLMRILAGLIAPTGGNLRIFGHDLSTLAGRAAARSLLGYLPQEVGLYGDLTAAEFLDYIATLKGVAGPAARRAQIAELLELVHLAEVAGQRLKTFSGGMKRRVGVAQALLGAPRLLIVDEPTAGLDPEERVRLRNLLSDAARRCTVLLSTHIVEDISQSCNDLAVIRKGQVIFRGSPRQLIDQAQGKVWHIATAGERPDPSLLVVSSLPLPDGVQYRVVGEPGDYPNAVQVQPSLEDGYLWLMQQ